MVTLAILYNTFDQFYKLCFARQIIISSSNNNPLKAACLPCGS